MIGEVIGHFRIERSLGAGGMGEVYLAHDLKLDRMVALKFLHPGEAADPEARRRFEHEARALAALDHPYVGAVHGVEEAGGRLFLVLAYVEGRSLEALLAEGPLPLARARVLLPRIAEGLAAAHRRGIVHRDVKSANIMVGDGDVPRLVDFGIALRGGQTRLTRTGVSAGTPGSMSPEVYRGDPPDARADVFALGVLFHEALTGRRPFDRANPAATMHAVLHEEPPPLPPGLGEDARAVEPVVRRCLAKDPAQRYPDAGAVADALRAWSGQSALAPSDGTVGATASAPTMRAPLAPRRARGRTWAAAGAALVLAGLAAWLVLRPHGGAAPPTSAGAAGRRAVAVLAFENLTGDASLDWMKRGVAELLGSALVQSPALDVYDAQRLGDLAGVHEGAPPPPTDAFLARHGIPRAITGTILRSGGDLRIEGRIVDTRDGRPVHSYAVEMPADSGFFHLVSRLIPDLEVALEVNLTGDREAEGWLREITTTSADAYRLYLRGHEALLASRWTEAATAYEQALAIDSTFIAARTELSGAYWNLGDEPKLSLTRAAMQRLRPRADQRGQLRIDLLESVVGGDPAGLIRAASALSQLYPENRFYTYLLGRGYYTARQYQRCLDTLRPLVEERYRWSWSYVLSARSAEQLGDTARAGQLLARGFDVTHADPELSYVYARFLAQRGAGDQARDVIDQALRSPQLAETPAGEGELRVERAKDLLRRGERAQAVDEIRRVVAVLPHDDEAWPEADSLARRLGAR